MRCGFSAKGDLAAEERGKVKTGKGKARKLTLGKKSFTGKRDQLVNGQGEDVQERPQGSSRRKKRLKAEALLLGPPRWAKSAMRINRTKLTLRVSRK